MAPSPSSTEVAAVRSYADVTMSESACTVEKRREQNKRREENRRAKKPHADEVPSERTHPDRTGVVGRRAQNQRREELRKERKKNANVLNPNSSLGNGMQFDDGDVIVGAEVGMGSSNAVAEHVNGSMCVPIVTRRVTHKSSEAALGAAVRRVVCLPNSLA